MADAQKERTEIKKVMTDKETRELEGVDKYESAKIKKGK